jgi:hypothetical protein
LRALLAIVLVGVGGVLVTAGPAGLLEFVRLLLANVGLLLIATAAAAVLAAALPRGARAGPTIVAIVGLLVLWLNRNNWSGQFWWTAAGAGLVLTGCSLALAAPVRRPAEVDPVWRRAAILFRTKAAVESDVETPAQITLVVVGTLLDVDLRQAKAPGRRFLELVISCWLGRVDIRLPPHWAVVGGRLHTSHHVRLKGRLDDRDIFPYPTLDQLEKIAEARAEQYACNNQRPLPVAIVVHVLGAGGEVELVGRE